MGQITNSISKGINNTLGGVVNSVKKIGTGKASLGDVFSLGSLIAPGGSIANIGKASLGSAIAGIGGQAAAGALQNALGGGQRQRSGGLGNLTDEAKAALQQQMQAAMQGLSRANAASTAAYNALDPMNNPQAFAAYQDALERGATQRGLAQAAALRDLGFGDPAQAGAILAAQNQAAMQGADYWRTLNDPFALAQRRAAQAQAALMPLQSLGQLYGLYSGSRGMDEQYRQPTALENIFAIAPDVLPYFLGGFQPEQPAAAPLPAPAPATSGFAQDWAESVSQNNLRGNAPSPFANRYGF